MQKSPIQVPTLEHIFINTRTARASFVLNAFSPPNQIINDIESNFELNFAEFKTILSDKENYSRIYENCTHTSVICSKCIVIVALMKLWTDPTATELGSLQ